MSTALSVLESLASNTGIDHSKEMNVIHDIVAECEKEIAFMHQVHDFVYGDERHNMINRLLRLNVRMAKRQASASQSWRLLSTNAMENACGL
ncbi:hypothetical protein [Klebsiella variicola]|uniref:hypothetical protein n=1 Tax=Klebsiella variicola TaxID=244366 RepID=UPI00352704AA